MGKIADALRDVTLPQQKKTQMLTLDREFVEMEAKVESLKAKLLNLAAKVNPLEREVDRLKQQAKQSGSTVEEKIYDDAGNLPEIQEKFVQALAHGNLDTNELAKKLGISREAVKYHAEEMEESKLIDGQPMFGTGAMLWRLQQKGRKYLMKRGLLK